jgi:hypothetical protein
VRVQDERPHARRGKRGDDRCVVELLNRERGLDPFRDVEPLALARPSAVRRTLRDADQWVSRSAAKELSLEQQRVSGKPMWRSALQSLRITLENVVRWDTLYTIRQCMCGAAHAGLICDHVAAPFAPVYPIL